LILVYVIYRLYEHFFPSPNINPTGKYVLISGSDTGFGHELAIQLDKQGFNVLAGVYLSDSIATLKNKLSSKATIFRLDITKQEDIDSAYQLIVKKTNTLHALVNNAGVGVSGYIDWITLESMRQTMEVNFFGHVAMTKKFLPLLIMKRDSRVINICSVAGFLAGSSMSAYSASKYALESFSDCLRREMVPWDLRVSIIEPGFMRTPIINGPRKSFNEFWSTLSKDAQTRWGEDFLKQQYDMRTTNPFIKYAEDPIKVVRVLEHAVMNTNPRIRYRPGWQSSFIFFPLSMLPAWIVDLLLMKINKLALLPASVYKQLMH
jgi:NAD(P)-dependent dehydrogenase (short-subunit alcohol dehydrogenase family)